MIIANHAHVFPKEVREDGTIDELKKLMDACGIDKCVCFAPFYGRLKEAGFQKDSNAWLADAIQKDPDLYGFGVVDFDAPDLKGQVKRIAEYGFKGIKLHPPYQEFKVDGEEAFQVYEQAQEEGLFLSFHCGMHWHRLKDNLPILYDEIAWNFPDLRISLEHIGGFHFFRDALAVMCNNSRGGTQPRIFAGWTSVSDKDGVGGWTLTDEELGIVIRQTGEGRSMFGLDFPYNDIDDIKYDMARIRRLPISDKAKENILGGTLSEILKIE